MERLEYGFFTFIKYENKKIPILITNNDIIDDIYDSSINILINNSFKAIEFGETTYKYKKCNIKIKEIKENNKEKIKD